MNVRLLFIALCTVIAGCGGAPEEDADLDSDSSDEALTSGGPSAYPLECPGRGWTGSIPDWNTVRGTYARTTFAPAGELSSLTIYADPSPLNQGTPTYRRTVDYRSQTGKVTLGVDNPAIGPVIQFRDARDQPRDLYWVLDRKLSATGKIMGICLGLAANQNGDATGARPFMLSRLF